jgi:hypothetical protein
MAGHEHRCLVTDATEAAIIDALCGELRSFTTTARA